MKLDILVLGIAAPVVIALASALWGALSPTTLMLLGALIGFATAWGNFYEVWKRPDLDLEEDLRSDGVKRLGIGIIHMILGTLAWHFYIPNYIVYKVYLALYYIGYWGTGVAASGVFILAFGLGLYMVRRYE